MYRELNNNPLGKNAGDSVIRAIATALNEDWDTVYCDLLLEGFAVKDVPSSIFVWGSYLYKNGFKRHLKGESVPRHYTIKEFAKDHPTGVFVVSTGECAVAVRDGVYYDVYDCGDRSALYYWEREGV